MMHRTPHRGRFVSFLATIPGIITAVAGLITALVALYQIAPDAIPFIPTVAETAPGTGQDDEPTDEGFVPDFGELPGLPEFGGDGESAG